MSNEGFKQLDSHIGLIYGDAITLARAKEILQRLEQNGFASTNVVFGIGSYTYQYNTRDTFGFALKSTLCEIDGTEHQICKDPKTDDGTKKSQRGRVAVLKNIDGTLKLSEGLSLKDKISGDQLVEVYRDGKLLVIKTSLISELVRGESMKTEKFVSFYGGPFSQWYPCDFTVDGISYATAEQYMNGHESRLFW